MMVGKPIEFVDVVLLMNNNMIVAFRMDVALYEISLDDASTSKGKNK